MTATNEPWFEFTPKTGDFVGLAKREFREFQETKPLPEHLKLRQLQSIIRALLFGYEYKGTIIDRNLLVGKLSQDLLNKDIKDFDELEEIIKLCIL